MLPIKNTLRTDQFHKKFSGIVNGKCHLTAGTNRNRELVSRLYILHLTVCSPTNCHLLGFIYKINFTMEWRYTACGDIFDTPQQRNVLRFQRMSARAEQIKCLSVQKEDSFLRFMHNQLCGCIKIFARMLPYEGAIVAFIFDDVGNICHDSASFDFLLCTFAN